MGACAGNVFIKKSGLPLPQQLQQLFRIQSAVLVAAFEEGVGHVALVGVKLQYLFLNSVLRRQAVKGHRAGLPYAVGAGAGLVL